jgi:phosphoribosylamine--glycine ligase
MNVLILGSGGREHTIAWRLSFDLTCTMVYIWPGNDGMEGEKIETLHHFFCHENFEEIIKDKKIHLVIPGSEKYLYEGISDWCRDLKLACFGPSSKASELEKSKSFSKKIMIESGIPTSHFVDFTDDFQNNFHKALSLTEDFKKPVIKISGPSLGKGVFVCSDSEEARSILGKLKEQPQPGMEEGILIEEGVTGKEVSLFYACSDEKYSYLGSAQDYKRVFDGDKGPNTGGMGAISPVPWVNDDFISRVSQKILEPTLKSMKKMGTPFLGILFLGLMVDGDEINLLEYNVRFGDPETQVLLPLIEGDLTNFIFNFCSGNFSQDLKFKKQTAVHVVKAAKGYPGLFGEEVEKGQLIKIQNNPHDKSKIIFSGVKKMKEGLVTNGGRVLGVTSWGKDRFEALQTCYESLEKIQFKGEHFRKDIGKNL